MDRYFGDRPGFEEATAQFSEALKAVVARTQDRNILYGDVVCDQLLYVAASVMLEAYGNSEDGTLEKWCDEMITMNDERYRSSRAFVDGLMAEQEAEDKATRKKKKTS